MSMRWSIPPVIFLMLTAHDSMAQNAPPVAPPVQLQPPPEALAAFEAREFKGASGVVLRYRLLKPLDYDATQKYPLVLFLHGAGERGDDNARQLIHGGLVMSSEALRRRHPAFVVAPQCPNEKKWVEVPWAAESGSMPEQPSESMQLVLELLPTLEKEFSIDANRIYGCGLSMGGYGTWDILARDPELLAAAIPICGGGDPIQVPRFKDAPVWAFHGSIDPAVPVARSRNMIKALTAAGGRPIYTEYEGVMHDSWTRTFENQLVWDWLFAQHK